MVESGIEEGQLVTLFGRCSVQYDGRAASTLGPGDRHVMLKPDGTALVHTDEGHQPVNWQPPGCTHEATVVDESLTVRSRRETPTEVVHVKFERIDLAATFDVTDETDLELVGTEDHLREQILDDPSLVEPGFVPRSTERETSAGAVDVFGEDAEGRAVVLELKRRRAGLDAVSQLRRYVEALGDDLHAGSELRGMVVAPSITEPARELLDQEGFEFVSLEPDSSPTDPA